MPCPDDCGHSSVAKIALKPSRCGLAFARLRPCELPYTRSGAKTFRFALVFAGPRSAARIDFSFLPRAGFVGVLGALFGAGWQMVFRGDGDVFSVWSGVFGSPGDCAVRLCACGVGFGVVCAHDRKTAFPTAGASCGAHRGGRKLPSANRNHRRGQIAVGRSACLAASVGAIHPNRTRNGRCDSAS